MSFASPIFLLALLVVPATLAFGLVVNRRRSRYGYAFTNLDLLAAVAKPARFPWRRWLPLALLLLSLATAATALARPRAHLPVAEQNATVVLLIDVSGSMRAKDVKPTRVGAAIAAMTTFLTELPRRFKIGLVAFSDSSEVISTPTHDRQRLTAGLSTLGAEAGTALGDGLETAISVTEQSLKQNGVRHHPGQYLPAEIVLLSDGAQDEGTHTPLQAANLAKKDGIRIDGVALGTPGGAIVLGEGRYYDAVPVPPDPAIIRAISRRSGGVSFTARNAARLSTIYRGLGSSIGHQTELRDITSWFALAAAVLLVGAVWSARAFASPVP
jgi:Ca-activated chloride channel family protein